MFVLVSGSVPNPLYEHETRQLAFSEGKPIHGSLCVFTAQVCFNNRKHWLGVTFAPVSRTGHLNHLLLTSDKFLPDEMDSQELGD